MATVLLILHSLAAVFLLGAVTHQALSAVWPTTSRASTFTSFRAVRGASYTKTIVILYVITATIGAVIYPTYRVAVREILQFLNQRSALGLFETKEHFVAIGLGLLPAYWYFWRVASSRSQLATRNCLTVLIACIVWYGFLVGHVLNNIKGFGL